MATIASGLRKRRAEKSLKLELSIDCKLKFNTYSKNVIIIAKKAMGIIIKFVISCTEICLGNK